MIILQAEIIDKSADRLIDLGAVGVMVIGLAFGIYYLVKYIRQQHTSETERILADKDETEKRADVLYREISDMKSEQIEKYVVLQSQTNEIHAKTVEALNNTTEALNNNSAIFSKLIEKL